MTKQELRLIYLSKRSTFSDEERARMDLSIIRQLIENLQDKQHIGILLPIAKFHEIDVREIMQNVQYQWYVPVTNFDDRMMRFSKITPVTQVGSNAYGIPEPLSFDFIDPKMLDAIVVPMLVADKKGFRVGYGKGFYDAFLPNCRADCLRIGISYFPPIESISDVGRHDEPLHLCISP